MNLERVFTAHIGGIAAQGHRNIFTDSLHRYQINILQADIAVKAVQLHPDPAVPIAVVGICALVGHFPVHGDIGGFLVRNVFHELGDHRCIGIAALRIGINHTIGHGDDLGHAVAAHMAHHSPVSITVHIILGRIEIVVAAFLLKGTVDGQHIHFISTAGHGINIIFFFCLYFCRGFRKGENGTGQQHSQHQPQQSFHILLLPSSAGH